MTVQYVEIGSIFQMSSGGTPSKKNPEYYLNGDIPWVKTGDLKKMYLDNVEDYITKLGVEKSSAKVFPKGTVLIAMYGATIGNCSILNFEAATNQACAAFLPNEKVLPEFLYFYLMSIKEKLVSLGVGGAQPNISQTILKSIKLPLIPLEKQIKVIEALSEGLALIDKRQSQITALDELTQSLFLEMFGDSKELPKRKIGEVIQSIEAGWSVSGEERPKTNDEIAVLKISAVTKGYFKDDEYKVISPEVKIKKAVFPQKGDIIVSRANTRELVGASAIVPKDYSNLILPDKLWKINLYKEIVTQEYFHTVINTKEIRNEFSKNATGTSGSMLNISMQKFKEIEIDLPSIIDQKIFSEKVENVQKMKVSFEKAKLEMENLYNSLLKKAFKGELFKTNPLKRS